MGVDLSSELESELGAEDRGPKGVGFLGREQPAPSPPAVGLESTAVSSPNGVRGKAPVAHDFEGFRIWNPAECVLKQQLFSFKTSKLEPTLLSRSG